MNDPELQSLVDNAIALHRDIAKKSKQLKALKPDRVKEAGRHPKALIATESGGKRWTTKGSDGCITLVNFPAAAPIPKIDAQSDLAKQLQDLAGDKSRRLFTTVKSYQLAENFNAEAAAILSEPKAEALVALCENESAPCVSFEASSLPLGEDTHHRSRRRLKVLE